MRAALAIVLGLAAAIGVVTACSVDVDLAGKGCPCPTGLLCDETTNTCVASLTPAPVDGGPPVAACGEAECKCTKTEDCRDPKRAYCGPSGTCVECLSTPNDTCTAGGYCNDKNQCVVGCKTDDECKATNQKCNQASHRCVDCSGDGDCAALGPNGKCSPSGKCVESCTGDGTPCGAGGTCCAGLCVQLASDEQNCGACGKACSTTNNTPTCNAGQCVFAQCAQGYAHCAPPGDNTGCETNIRSAANCGKCGAACTPTQVVFANNVACSSTGTCTYSSCQQGHVDQDRDPTNGCEDGCGEKNVRCCPPPQKQCNGGQGCKTNGTCF